MNRGGLYQKSGCDLSFLAGCGEILVDFDRFNGRWGADQRGQPPFEDWIQESLSLALTR